MLLPTTEPHAALQVHMHIRDVHNEQDRLIELHRLSGSSFSKTLISAQFRIFYPLSFSYNPKPCFLFKSWCVYACRSDANPILSKPRPCGPRDLALMFSHLLECRNVTHAAEYEIDTTAETLPSGKLLMSECSAQGSKSFHRLLDTLNRAIVLSGFPSGIVHRQ